MIWDFYPEFCFDCWSDCARDKVLYNSLGLTHSYVCDGAGNYKTLQRIGNNAFCMDADGFPSSKPVIFRFWLNCWTGWTVSAHHGLVQWESRERKFRNRIQNPWHPFKWLEFSRHSSASRWGVSPRICLKAVKNPASRISRIFCNEYPKISDESLGRIMDRCEASQEMNR